MLAGFRAIIETRPFVQMHAKIVKILVHKLIGTLGQRLILKRAEIELVKQCCVSV
jgi:hypothetical protein